LLRPDVLTYGKIETRHQRTEENIMKLRTKLAIFLVAAVLSLAGFGVIAGALSVDHIMTAVTPTTQVSVSITS
jgi:hypothetical protein